MIEKYLFIIIACIYYIVALAFYFFLLTPKLQKGLKKASPIQIRLIKIIYLIGVTVIFLVLIHFHFYVSGQISLNI